MKISRKQFLLGFIFGFLQLALADDHEPYNSIIHPSDTSRDLTISLPKSLPTRTELATRDPPDLSSNRNLALHFVTRAALGMVVGVSFDSLASDCRDWHEGENQDEKQGLKCVVSAIGAAVGICAEIAFYGKFYYELTRAGVIKLIEITMNTAITNWVGGNVALVGPYLRSSAFGQPPPPQNNARDLGRLYRRVEDRLTSKIGVEVRHIGFWDGTVGKNNSQSGMEKRENGNVEGIIPTFGLQRDGVEMHFAYHGQTADKFEKIKIGYGPGPETEENKRRIKARDLMTDLDNILAAPQYNQYYFDSGGIDMVLHANMDEDIALEIELPGIPGLGGEKSFEGENDNGWMRDQIECYFGVKDPSVLLDESNHPAQFDAPGLWFQLFDNQYRGTISMGAIAAFTADKSSIIEYMRPEGGIPIDRSCSFILPFE